MTRPTASVFVLLLCASTAIAQSSDSILPGSKPSDAPAELKALVGIYKHKSESKSTFTVLEREGKLFSHNMDGSESELVISLHMHPSFYLSRCCEPADPSTEGTQSFRIKPLRPLVELRNEALNATPPKEKGSFKTPELIELASLDPAFHLDIRYATPNDFLGVPVYTQARAFLQRPAGEAILRVLRKLEPLGYGLLIHDGYRPWYVTKIFWDATPPEGKIFVADPAQGSRHNRGCAVDLTLYDLKTGQPVEMTSGYDEMSPRSFPNYPGGTALQRWHRDLLRRAMESEGFTVYESEWWHFDYKDWPAYGILNIPFEKLGVGSTSK